MIDITKPPYNCVGDGVTDCTVGLQAAVNASLLVYDEVFVPRLPFKISAPITVNGPLRLRGAQMGVGPSGATLLGSSLIVLANPTQDGFVVQSLQGVDLSDFAITSPSLKTAGSAINLTGTLSGTNGNTRIRRIALVNQYDGITMQGDWWNIDGAFISDFSRYGVRVLNSFNADYGDNIISHSKIFGGAANQGCVRYESGGALTLLGNKLLGSWIGLWASVSAGPTGTLQMLGNSVEQQTITGFKLSQSVPGVQYGNVQLVGNQWSIVGGTPQSVISIDQGSAGWLKNVVVSGNILNLAAAGQYSAISIYDGNGIVVSGNVLNANGVAGYQGISIAGGSQNGASVDNQIINFPSGKHGPMNPGIVVRDF